LISFKCILEDILSGFTLLTEFVVTVNSDVLIPHCLQLNSYMNVCWASAHSLKSSVAGMVHMDFLVEVPSVYKQGSYFFEYISEVNLHIVEKKTL